MDVKQECLLSIDINFCKTILQSLIILALAKPGSMHCHLFYRVIQFENNEHVKIAVTEI